MSRIVLGTKVRGEKPTFVVNHRHEQALAWNNPAHKTTFNYVTRYADADAEWITVDLFRR
ncbi:hypothetical protein HFO58_32035 [Rhizobium leguminosarum]|uniref:hypothetical protein n=1 Tax=Rhizobium leguminosarum TaxID=384 RepID=UPI001C93F6C1|nr:hypothetical protein [Rhizobium leguminosarum]MBY5537722.1 hypothetical protein [Rhizobium leguminosarum]